MSRVISERINCPNCGEVIYFQLWKSLNTSLNPEEKDNLISGELFSVTCKKCNKKHQLNYPILYNDMKNHVMIQLALDEADEEIFYKGNKMAKELLQKTLSKSPTNYRYRVVKSQADLREKAIIFDCGLDDRIVELVKVLCWNMLQDEHPDIKVEDIHFEAGTPHRLVILSDTSVYSTEFDIEGYNTFNLNIMSIIDEKSKDCFCINHEWAINLLIDYMPVEGTKDENDDL